MIPLQHSTERDREHVKMERCGHCQQLFPSDWMIDEDGIRKCPNGVDITTESYKSAILEREAARADLYNIEPNISQAVMSRTIPATVTAIMDASNHLVYLGAPLIFVRPAHAILSLVGRGFTSADTVTLPAGFTHSAPLAITATSIALDIIASGVVAAGVYSIALNGNTIRGILGVR